MKKVLSIITSLVIFYLISISVLSQNKIIDTGKTKNLRINGIMTEDGDSYVIQSAVDSFSINEIYAYGMVPPVGLPDTICASVKKFCDDTSAYVDVHFVIENTSPYSVKLDTVISISNTYVDDTVICIVAPPYYYPKSDRIIVNGVAGDTSAPFPCNTVKFYIPKEFCHDVTPGTFSQVNICDPDDGGVGFGGLTGNFATGFRNNSSGTYYINSVEQSFLNSPGGGNNPYKIVIYGDNGSGNPGSLLYISQQLSTPPGMDTTVKVIHNIPSPVGIPGYSRFFVGCRQTSAANISASYQIEDPIRPRTFYLSYPDTSNTWYDFSNDFNNFRMDISAIGGTGVLKTTAIPQGFYNFSMLNMRDTFRVYLRNSVSPFAIVDSSKGIIDSVIFANNFVFPLASTNSYYVEVKHRNSIATWSSAPVSYINGSSSAFNFTTSSSQAYGSNLILVGTKYCLFSGDVNQDGFIDLTDLILVNNDANSFLTGYNVTDLNGNDITDLTDVLITYNNSNNFVMSIVP